jgi:integrase
MPLNGHFVNYIVTLSKVTTLQLQRVYNKLLKEGKKDGTPLSIKTVRNVHGAVHIALETGVTWGLLRVNPASRCKLPPAPKREAMALDFTAARKLLECSSEHWLADFLALDIACGARRGEMLALAWPDVDFEVGVLTISKSLEQTKAGLRAERNEGTQHPEGHAAAGCYRRIAKGQGGAG